jgi:feruloyl esterase
MRQLLQLIVLVAATLSLLAACGSGSSNSSAVPVAQTGLTCDDSLKTAFKPDANTTVLQVKHVKKGDPYFGYTPQTEALIFPGSTVFAADLCMVKLLVGPGVSGPTGAPSTSIGIGIEVWLPEKDAWIHRVHALGTPGWADGGPETTLDVMTPGSGMWGTDDSPANVAATEGAVTSMTDTGIQSSGGSFALNPDKTDNAAGWRDWTYSGLYEQAVKTKALAAAYYGSPPQYSYFSGGSGGGRQALHVAQNLPEQYNGILAAMPGPDWSSFIAEVYPALLAERDLGGNDPVAQLDLASRAAVSACDMVGGQHLGFILDIKSCRYDPTKDKTVLCTADGGTNTTSACLTQTQAQVMNKIWYGLTVDGSVPDPAVDNGFDAPLSGVRKWYGYPRGGYIRSLLNALTWLGGPGVGRDNIAIALHDPSMGTSAFVNATGNGQDGWKNLTYAQLADAYDKFKAMNAQFGFNANNPDLSRLRKAGTKLLHTSNVHDASVWLQGHTSYYDSVVNTMGGLASVQQYYRLYVLPGLFHGEFNGSADREANPPAPVAFQTYQALVNWVEKGASPDTMVFTSPADGYVPPFWTGFGPTVGPVMTLPACAYPTKATYVSADIHAAASYACQ